VRRIVQAVQVEDTVILDLTFSLRHLPFVYFVALTYLTALRHVKLEGIYYAAHELRGAGGPPIINLTRLFGLVQWYHALQAAVDTGDLRLLAREVRQEVARLAEPARFSRVRDRAREVAEALANGLPLEVGLAATGLLRSLDELVTGSADPPSLLALESLRNWACSWVIPVLTRQKADVALTSDELERQLKLVQWYVDRGDLPKAMLLLREWMVSAVLLDKQESGRWLDYQQRHAVERSLNSLAERARQGLAADDRESAVARTWQELTRLRNSLAHAGMTWECVRAEPSVYNLCR